MKMKYPAWANYLVFHRGEYFLLSDIKTPYKWKRATVVGGAITGTKGIDMNSTMGVIARDGKIIQYLGEEENE
ncbi:MAG: hypothetical protein ACRCVU_13780 [Flavobacterium sp.]